LLGLGFELFDVLFEFIDRFFESESMFVVCHIVGWVTPTRLETN
jgi:hypothetical protein